MDDQCFACGAENQQGLRLKIQDTTGGVKAKIKLPPHFQGYSDVVHGGIVSTILDELAVWAAYKKGFRSATAEISVRFRIPMRTEEEYEAFGAVTRVKYGLVQAEAEIKDKDGRTVAAAAVKLFKIG
jgi:uncharacterized protein (TIGR00369 family)